MDNKFLTRPEAADYLTNTKGLPISNKTLAKMASEGGGPHYCRFGARRVVYMVADLEAWVKERLSKPISNTSQYNK